MNNKQTDEMVLNRFHNMVALVTTDSPTDPRTVETNRETVDYILRTAKWSRDEFVSLIKSLKLA